MTEGSEVERRNPDTASFNMPHQGVLPRRPHLPRIRFQ
jgi:hypothetical protein